MSAPDAAAVRTYLLDLQDRICAALEAEDGGSFREDRQEGPGGTLSRPRVLEDGAVFEKAAVHFTHARGDRLPPAASAHRPDVANAPFEAVSVSLITHPKNPYVPTSHANLRFFLATPERANPARRSSTQGGAEGDAAQRAEGERSSNPARRSSTQGGAEGDAAQRAEGERSSESWWFGGGFDLTPYYGFDEDAVAWHRAARDACHPLGPEAYPRFKKWCDEYFSLKHRGEARGVGGLFFDDLTEGGFERCFEFVRSVGDHYLDAYLPIVRRRRNTPFGEREREFQLYRRGRYVEFNLVYDRGTLYGLQSGRRVESVLSSMPPLVRWRYDWKPEPGSPEAALAEHFLVPRDWV